MIVALAVSTFFYFYRPSFSSMDMGDISGPAARELSVGTAWIGTGTAGGSAEVPGANGWEGLVGQLSWFCQQYFPLLVAVWFIGVFILTLRMLGELVLIQHLRYNRSRPVAGEWQGMLKELARQLNIGRNVELRESLRISTPMVVGVLRPVILLPVGLLTGLSPRQVESILAHELAHIRRYDYLANLLQSLAEILLFFNPAIWWVSSMIRIEREHCCDDVAIGLTGDAVTFVKTLATLEEYRHARAHLAVGFAGSGGSLLGRIQRVLDSNHQSKLPFRFFWSTAILLVILISVAFTGPRQELIEAELLNNEITRLNEEPAGEIFADQEHSLPEVAAPAPEGLPVAVEPVVRFMESPPVDTVPKKDKQFQEEKAQLEQEYRARMLELEKMVNDLHNQQQQIEARGELDRHAREKQLLELEKQAQEMANRKELENKERQIETSRIRAQILDLEVELQSLGSQVSREMQKEAPNQEKVQELEARADKLMQERLKLEKEANAQEFNSQTEMLELEKERQIFFNNQMVIEKDLQIQLHEKQLQTLELEQQAREIQMQMEEFNHEFQVKLLELERRFRKEEE